MRIDIGSDLPEFRALMRKRKSLVPVVVKKAVVDATREMFAESRQQLSTLIYNQPIPTRKQGKRKIRSGKSAGKYRKFKTPKDVAAWRRTSNLLRKERFFFRGNGANITGIIDNSAAYAKARHNLNRPSPIDGKTRSAPWRDKAREQGAPRARAIFREALKTLRTP